jgi:hypothetical protein
MKRKRKKSELDWGDMVPAKQIERFEGGLKALQDPTEAGLVQRAAGLHNKGQNKTDTNCQVNGLQRLTDSSGQEHDTIRGDFGPTQIEMLQIRTVVSYHLQRFVTHSSAMSETAGIVELTLRWPDSGIKECSHID